MNDKEIIERIKWLEEERNCMWHRHNDLMAEINDEIKELKQTLNLRTTIRWTK